MPDTIRLEKPEAFAGKLRVKRREKTKAVRSSKQSGVSFDETLPGLRPIIDQLSGY